MSGWVAQVDGGEEGRVTVWCEVERILGCSLVGWSCLGRVAIYGDFGLRCPRVARSDGPVC